MIKEVREKREIKGINCVFLALFWSSPKRPPKEVVFDFEDSVHRGFVMSLANLLAEVYGLERHTNVEKFREVIERIITNFFPLETFFLWRICLNFFSPFWKHFFFH